VWRRKKGEKTPFLMLLPSLVIVLLLVGYPLGFSLVYSFYLWNLAVAATPQRFVGLFNYATLVSDPHFFNAILVTFNFAITAVILQMLLGLGVAIVFSRSFRGASVMRALLILPTAVAPIVSGLLFRYMYYQSLGMGIIPWMLAQIGISTPVRSILGDYATALYGIIAVDVWLWTPFFALAFIAGLQSTPVDQIEAARVDGAGPVSVFRHVTLPSMRRLIAIVFIIFFMQEFNVFDIVYALTGGGPAEVTTTVSYYLYRQGMLYYNIGYAAAMTWFIAILVTIVVNVYFYFAFKGTKV
jgi:multiple sugar transport system permease protein